MHLKISLSCLLGLCLAHATMAQNASFFTPVSAEKIRSASHAAPSDMPAQFEAFQLDEQGLRAALESAPWESTPAASQQNCVVGIPTGNGQIERFSVWRIAMLDAELAAAFPDIRTYEGVSLKNSSQKVRFSVTPRGFRAMVFQPNGGDVMVKHTTVGTHNYIVYKFQDGPQAKERGVTLALDADGWGQPKAEHFVPKAEDRGQEMERVRLKTYRYCVAAPGEFTQDHGGTKPLAIAAVTEYTNIVSAVFEKELAVRLQLTNGVQFVTFTDPNNDPYMGGTTVQDYAGQNTGILDQYTNINSLDIGHVYVRYQGGAQGVGGLGVTCNSGKGLGCSASNINPSTGDYYDFFLVIVGQEIGHQMAGGHTWNRCGGGDGRFGITAYEPGSGSTIMSYGGLCGSDDYVNEADLYFHAGSIQELKTFATFIGTCGSTVETTNNPPVVALPYQDNFNIPIGTPFELNGSASDPDGDALSYSWEGLDVGPETALGQPQGSAAIFRSWPAVTETNRYFPRLNTVLANGFDVSEQLPTYTRDLTFRLTARDNKTGGGGVAWADVAFRAVEQAGPFVVLSPNASNEVWRVGELAQVRWDVANTNGSLVNCQHVNIRLSLDGGQTYPLTLAAATENDGNQYVLVPNELTSVARLRVEAADNVFFDLSNTNFSIQAPVEASLTLGLSTDGSTVCMPADFNTTVVTASVLGYNTPISLDLVGSLPPGATASFNTTTINPGESASFSVNLQSVTVEGSFSFTIRAISGTDTLLRPISLFLRRNDFTGFVLQSPANGATEAGLTQTLRWAKGLDADNYDIQFSDSPAFTNILASSYNTTLDSLKINFLLEKGKAYFWRVRPRNECGLHAWSEPFFFSTFAENCLTFSANDLPKNISANGTPIIETTITVVQGGTISDLVVSNIDIYHDYFKDLEAHLISPQGTDVLLWKDRCSNFSGVANFGLSDDAPGNFVCPPPTNGSFTRPQNPLQPIIGQNSTGLWTLRVRDKVLGSGGTLSNFQLQFCQSVDIQAPFVVNNLVMPLPSGTNRAITPDFLMVQDANTAAAQITFTVMTVPERGFIEKTGFGELKPGDQFTQADIDGGLLRFFDYGISADPDGFRFMVTDGEGGFFGTPMFVAQPLVGTQSAGLQQIDFSVFPNPATQSVWVAFGLALESAAQVNLYNLSGQWLRGEKMSAGQQRLPIELGQLPKGVYVVRVETETGVGVRKLVVE